MIRHIKKSDFSLIEVLVALTIMAVSFGVYMQALSLNIKNTGIAKNYVTASLLAKEKIIDLTFKDEEDNDNKEAKAKKRRFWR